MGQNWRGYGISGSTLGRDFDGLSGVYALIDPRTDIVMYVGQAENIGLRYRQHCNPRTWQENWLKFTWISELATENLIPGIKILAECSYPEIDEVEQRLVREFREIGQAELNITAGGTSRTSQKSDIASKDDWIDLASKIRLIQDLLGDVESQTHAMINTVTGNKVRSIRWKLDKLKSTLDDIVCKRFPNWDRAHRIFYGQKPDKDPKSPLL